MNFLWHDYETFGTDPALDRPAQFAAIRTNPELEPVADPLTCYCQPQSDYLPHPFACLVTGITPRKAQREGIVEAEFAGLVHAAMMHPGTCSVGYNSLRFDDEFTRNIFFRNFLDPYEREYRNGNSRWDLIDLARMCYALRPDGIGWPEREPGVPSFRLEHLSAANDIAHEAAHDALADVRATIGLARLLRRCQPRLFEWGLRLRDQKLVMEMLNPANPEPLLHTTARFPADRGCTSIVLPLINLPDQPKAFIVFDLMADPSPLLELSPDDIADRTYTPGADMPDDIQRLPLKRLRANRVPMVAPLGTLRGVDLERIALDPELCLRRASQIKANLPTVREKLLAVFARPYTDGSGDPDVTLYSGGFFPDSDRTLIRQVRATRPDQLGASDWKFRDPRLPTMLFRYRARNWPQTLNNKEFSQWENERLLRLTTPGSPGRFCIDDFQLELDQARESLATEDRANRVLDELEDWATQLLQPA